MASSESNSWDIGLNDKWICYPYYRYLSPLICEEIDKVYLYAKRNDRSNNAISVSLQVNEPANCIRDYLVNKFGIEVIRIIGNGSYIHYQNGYAYFTGINKRRCRYVMEKELNRGYLCNEYQVHHIDLNKLNDNIKNLFLAYNVAHHRRIHGELYNKTKNKRNVSFDDILDFTKFYMDDKLNDIQVEMANIKSNKNELEIQKQSIIDYINLLNILVFVRETSFVFKA